MVTKFLNYDTWQGRLVLAVPTMRGIHILYRAR
jgi:hypothetical protein